MPAGPCDTREQVQGAILTPTLRQLHTYMSPCTSSEQALHTAIGPAPRCGQGVGVAAIAAASDGRGADW